MPGERRSVPRLELPQPISAKIKAALPARILDISSQGVQLELTTCLRPNVGCDLRIQLGDGDIHVRAVVRRCKAWGFALDEKAQRVLVYRAGMEFEDVSPEVMARLTAEFLFKLQPPEEAEEPELLTDQSLVYPSGEPHRAPSSHGPVRIRISSERVRAILGREPSTDD